MPSAAQRAWLLSFWREESGARTGKGFFSPGKIRVFRMDSPELSGKKVAKMVNSRGT